MGLFNRLFGREIRATLREPPSWLSTAMLGGEKSAAGLSVSPTKALTLGSYYAAIRNISEDIAKLPLITYRSLKPRGKERATTHPVYRLLRDTPNKSMSSMSFRETLTMHAIGWGNGLAEIVRGPKGQPVAMWPLDPSRVRIEADPVTGDLKYVIPPKTGGKEIVLHAQDVFHLHGLGFDGLRGYSVAHLARESIGHALAIQQFGAKFFANGAAIGTVFSYPHALSDKARQNFKELLKEHREGLENAHKTLILEHDAKVFKLGIPPDDAQFIESAQFSVEELGRWLRITPIKIGHLLRATYDNISEENRSYVTDTLTPWAVRWEQEIARKLLAPRSGLHAEHLFESLLRGNTKERFESYEIAIRAGFMSRNEVRIRESMNEVDGLDEFPPLPTITAKREPRSK